MRMVFFLYIYIYIYTYVYAVYTPKHISKTVFIAFEFNLNTIHTRPHTALRRLSLVFLSVANYWPLTTS